MASGMMTRERRRAPRVTERIAVSIADAGAELTTHTNNLSASGTYCTLDRVIAPMSKLQLRFDLPQGGRRVMVRCAGVVVRVDPVIASADRGRFNVAIFFTELSARNRAAIERFVRQRLAAASAPDS